MKTRAKRENVLRQPGSGATHGLYPKEAEVVDLFESGWSKEQIVAFTGMSKKRVDDLVSQYANLGARCDGWKRRLSVAADSLLARIQQVHGAGVVMG